MGEPYTLHPEPGDLEPLGRYIARMPGGRYIQEAWKREPPRIVAVSVRATQPEPLLQLITAAYPPHPTGDYQLGVGGLVLCVPETVVELLRWYANTSWDTHELFAPAGAEVHHYAKVVASLWHEAEWGDEDAVAKRYETIKEEAKQHSLDFSTLLETAVTLWRDEAYLDFQEALERAVTVLVP